MLNYNKLKFRGMKLDSRTKIVDITKKTDYEKYLYRCLAPMPFKRYATRQKYLQEAIPKGFRKKLLISNGEVVGTIEYAPAEASGYPIKGDNIIVMNCIWVLRKAKGHNFGKLLIRDMVKSEKNALGFAIIALENHWSPWFMKRRMEKLGFMSIDSIQVKHKIKHPEQGFAIHLMWIPMKENVKPPIINWQKLLDGETFCMAHPLYHPQRWEGHILELMEM
jgi:hypothetical protein